MSHNQENNKKIAEDVNRQINNKLILKPIGIKDLNKNYKSNNLNNSIFENSNNIVIDYMKINSEYTSNNIPKNNPSHNPRFDYKANYNSNSTLNLIGQNNLNIEKNMIETYITGKNFFNGESYNNLKNFQELLKKEKLREAPTNSNLNSTTFDVNNQSPVCEKKIIDKFSKTSNFEFNLIENLDGINLNTDISLIEENLKMNKGELIKKLKSLYNDFNDSKKILRNNNSCINNNKSYFNNTGIIEKEKNNNLTRIETIFENYEVKIDEMILLDTRNSTRKLGSLKKMVHTASLNLYVVRVLKL